MRAQQQLLSLLASGCLLSHVTPAAGVAAAAAAGAAMRARTATSGTQFTCFTSTRVQILTHARDASTAAPTERSAPRGCVPAREKERANTNIVPLPNSERASERAAHTPAKSVPAKVADKALTFSEALCGKVSGALSGTSRPGTHFTCFPSAKVQILTPEAPACLASNRQMPQTPQGWIRRPLRRLTHALVAQLARNLCAHRQRRERRS